MTFEQMQYVVAIAKYGTISQASQEINVSHPAISRAITNLEIELGINIFVRSRSGSRLTIEGEQVVSLAKQIIELYDEVKKINKNYVLKGAINIFSYPIDDFICFYPSIIKFQETFPELTINVSEKEVSQILESLRNNQTGLAFVLLSKRIQRILGNEFDYVPLYDCRLSVICSKRHPAAEKKSITLEECIDYPVIVNSDPMIIDNITTAFKDIGTPKITFYSNNDNLRKKLLRDGKSIAFFSPATILRGQAHLVDKDDLKVIPVDSQNENMYATYVCIYKKGRKLSFLERKLLALIKRESKNLSNL